MDATALLAAIEATRWCGVCHLAICSKPNGMPLESILGQYLNAFTAPSEELTILSNSQAYAILTRLLAVDMAYEAEIMPLEEAEKLASVFFALFSNQSVFFSNSSWGTDEVAALADDFEPKLRGWSSFTEATFDSGIIICDSDKIGIAWFEDED